MKKKKKYIIPTTELIVVKVEGFLPAETRFTTTRDRTLPSIKIETGRLQPDEEIAAKPHNVWDTDEDE